MIYTLNLIQADFMAIIMDSDLNVKNVDLHTSVGHYCLVVINVVFVFMLRFLLIYFLM